jgi:hypothetical protein
VAEGQLVQHVRQRFRMHQPVFDSYVKQLVPGLSGRVIQRHSSQSVIEGAADLTYILTHLIQRRPIGWLVCRQSAVNWIDAKSKQVVEF